MRGSINLDQSKCTLTLDNTSNVILDHCSISWGRWDDVHIKDANNITWQYCIISEGIDPQRFGSITDGTRNWTVTHCLWADNKSRNPKMKCYIQYVNNVVYNFGSGIVGGHSAADNYQDVINNYFIAGPSNGGSIKYFDQWTSTDHLYSVGNYADGDCDGTLNGTLITDYSSATPMSQPNLTSTAPLNIESAENAYKNIVLYAGDSRVRDSHDARIIKQLTSLGKEGAFIDNEQDVGGIGSVSGGTSPKDSDGDGMPDDWENANGLNPNINDANGDVNNNGYSNIEDYVNSMAQKSDYLMYPLNLKAKLSDSNTVVLSWTNSETDATGVIVEMSEDGKTYTRIDSLSGSAVSDTIKNIIADKFYRIINYGTVAYNSSTTTAGTAKYLTFISNGALGSTEDFEWDNPSLLWSFTADPADSTRYFFYNRGTKKYLSSTNVTVNSSQQIAAVDNASSLKIVYVGNAHAAQSGVSDSVSMFRINSPSNSGYQIRAKNFADTWLWGSGTITRADMIFTFTEIDSTMITLFTGKLRKVLTEAESLSSSAVTGDVTLGYPSDVHDVLLAKIKEGQTFLSSIDKDKTTQEQVDSATAVVSAAFTAFKSKQIFTLAGYDSEKVNNIYSYGTTSNASASTANTSIQRRYLVAIKSADGQRDSLIYKVGLTDAQIEAGSEDTLSNSKEAQWIILGGLNGTVYVRNEKYGSFMQISNTLATSPSTVYPYYAKDDNGKHAFYMETSNTNNRCFNVGTPNSDGKSGPLSFASPADRTRLRWVIEELDITSAVKSITSSVNKGSIVSTKYYNLVGAEIGASKSHGIFIEKSTYADGTVKAQKVIK